MTAMCSQRLAPIPVSYTHLDVYKRQIFHRLAAHALDLLLIAVEEAGVLAAHHHAHGQQGQHHGEQAQQALSLIHI